MLVLIFSLFGVVMGCNVRPMDFKCDDGWTPVQRKVGGGCVKILQIKEFVNGCILRGGGLSTVRSLEELKIYVNLLKNSGLKIARILAYASAECKCNDIACPITETCNPPSVWSGYGIPIEVLEKVELYYLNENKYGTSILITTENESGLTDNHEGYETSPVVCVTNAS